MKNKNKEEKMKMPKTKKQKLNIKHRNLLIIIATLIVIIIILLLLPTDEKKVKKTPITTTKKEDKYNLTVYDDNSLERPYAVMIPNDSSAKKRQYGLGQAYITYEITVEGGITRLLALFKDVNVEKIGPVRSSRHYYLDYALENDAIYVHFGWSPQAESDIKTLGINNLNGLFNPSNMFWRDKTYSSPNNAFTSSEKIKTAASDKNYRLTSENYKLLEYVSEVDLTNDETVQNANSVKVDYAGNAYVKYIYNDEFKYYLRYNNQSVHIDNLTGEQIHTKNILILKMNTDGISGDEKGRQNLNNIGKGEGFYITEGKAIKITWEKEKRDGKTIYKNSKGDMVKINDGNTFIQIQPIKESVVIE